MIMIICAVPAFAATKFWDVDVSGTRSSVVCREVHGYYAEDYTYGIRCINDYVVGTGFNSSNLTKTTFISTPGIQRNAKVEIWNAARDKKMAENDGTGWLEIKKEAIVASVGSPVFVQIETRHETSTGDQSICPKTHILNLEDF